MRDEFRPAIEALQADLREIERKASETKVMINRLCELSGAPPMYADTSAPDHQHHGALMTMRSDQFYGRVLTTAAREYLEMRKAANLGPASPRDIHQALLEGGFKFDTKIEANAITGVRATLRKNSSIFHRLPNNQYGLLVWYPNAKSARQDDDEDSAPATKRSEARPKAKVGKRTGARPSVAPFVQGVMQDGTDWTTERLKTVAIAQGVAGINESTKKNTFHAALLGLRSRGVVKQVGNGAWRIETEAASTGSAIAKIVPMKGAA